MPVDPVVLPPVEEPVVLVVEPVLPDVPVVPVVLLVLLVPVEPVLPEVLLEPVVPVELVVEELDDVVPSSSFFLSFLQLVASNNDSENAPAIKMTFGVCDIFIWFCFTTFTSSTQTTFHH